MKDRELRCYDYVNRPYAEVREILTRDAVGIFQRATGAASARVGEMTARLHQPVGPIELGVDVVIKVVEITEGTSPFKGPMTSLQLAWAAERGAGLFPAMSATLSLYSLSRGDTQLDLLGSYRPPLGIVGRALDATLLGRIADATVLRFVQEVAIYLRQP